MPVHSVPSAPDERRYQSIAALLKSHADQHGEKPFIVSVDEGGRNITFNKLWRVSNRMSRFLADRNVARGGRVAVLSDNRLSCPFLYFSLLRYGAAFCTINVEVNSANLRECWPALAQS